jgi:uncharacterized protein (DUF2225 family)
MIKGIVKKGIKGEAKKMKYLIAAVLEEKEIDSMAEKLFGTTDMSDSQLWFLMVLSFEYSKQKDGKDWRRLEASIDTIYKQPLSKRYICDLFFFLGFYVLEN